jgi:hypothetical protein
MAHKPPKSLAPRMVELLLPGSSTREAMHYPTLIKRLVASGFVLAGGIAIVLMIWRTGSPILPRRT